MTRNVIRALTFGIGALALSLTAPAFADDHGCKAELCLGSYGYLTGENFTLVEVVESYPNGTYDFKLIDEEIVRTGMTRKDFTQAWGCVDGMCVNDLVEFKTGDKRQGLVAAVQVGMNGAPDKLVIWFWFSPAKWDVSTADLTLLAKNPTNRAPEHDMPSHD
jgi:hypothetical protein